MKYKLGLPISKKYFYETYAIPEPEPGDDLLTPSDMEPDADDVEDPPKNSPPVIRRGGKAGVVKTKPQPKAALKDATDVTALADAIIRKMQTDFFG